MQTRPRDWMQGFPSQAHGVQKRQARGKKTSFEGVVRPRAAEAVGLWPEGMQA